MASNKTPNLNLHTWEPTDYLQRVEFNDNFETIDGKINELATYDTVATNQLFVNSLTGSNTNTGTVTSPFKTLDRAISELMSKGDGVITGAWEIKLTGTFTEGVAIYNLPRFRFPLKITGDVDTNGKPVTIFDGTTSTRDIGLRIEKCPDLRVEISNLYFKNFKNNFNGYGLLMKSGGYIDARNCIAENCDIGFAAVRNVSFFFGACKGINSATSNFRAQYSASGTFGDSSNPCTATGGPEGFFISRNAVAHVDYSTADGCTYAGLRVDMNSRCGVIGTTFMNCATGVLTQGGGEWINDGAIFANNTANMINNGVGRETRLYSSGATNEFRIGVDLTTKTHTGTTSNTTLYLGSQLGRMPENFFLSKYQRLRFLVRGNISGNGTKTVSVYSTDSLGVYNTQLASFGQTMTGEFIMEVFVYPIDLNSVEVTANIQQNGEPNKLYTTTRAVDMSKERLFRVLGQLSDPTATITLRSFEVFLMG
ncbi:hypothetical protein [Priestia megaterium]|uniref:hypothetical protein n=1 Tax=Priestia megaterium TaxID=1404 RepID=UPI001D553439|nr:hypothetical protein [Priestia megaterium]CAH0305358.1 hypothetical protein SRABI82_04707 [Priestia megaterium]